jgi:hypothetical protein
MGLSRGDDLAGLYFIDEQSGEPFYIEYGMDRGGYIGIIYDRRESLNVASSFSVVAGYDAGVTVRAGFALWTYAGVDHSASVSELTKAGFGPDQVPLWGFNKSASASGLTRLSATSSPVIVDLALGFEFEITASGREAITISQPSGSAAAGRRLTLTLCNASTAPLGPVTWAREYKMASWISPAAAHSRSITFRYDGTNWVEVGRTPNDVPQ